MPYRLSTLAEQDLEEIWSYVAEDASPTTADRLIDAITERFGLPARGQRPGARRVHGVLGNTCWVVPWATSSLHPSQWAAIRSVAEKIGCPVEVLRRWVRQAERDAGQRP